MQRIGKHKAATLTYRVTDGRLSVDGHHSRAGQRVTSRVQVIEVCDTTPDEIASGRFSLA